MGNVLFFKKLIIIVVLGLDLDPNLTKKSVAEVILIILLLIFVITFTPIVIATKSVFLKIEYVGHVWART